MSMGSVRKRGKTWTWYLDIGPDPLTGRRRQVSKGGFKTKKAAQEDLNTAIAKRQRGELAKRSKRTVRAFLEDEWLPTVEANRRPSTAANYRTNIKVHVVPLIGDVRLQALSPFQLNAFYAKLQADHRRDGQPLAPKRVRNIHAMLHKALRDALRWGLVTRNVADAVDAPNGLSPEMQAWTAAQLRAFLAHARHDRLFAAWMLFATTGMHRGEVAGLRDLDLDLAAGWVAPRRPRVVVNYQVDTSDPKTFAGRRLLALDPATVAALREHLEQRKAERAQLAEWRVQVEASGLLFTEIDGTPLHPDRFTRRFRRLVAKVQWHQDGARRVGLPKLRLHDVRHTYATVALQAGVPPKVVSERLGHASVAVTLRIYAHVLPGMDRDAANTVASVILGTTEGPASAPADPSVDKAVDRKLFDLDTREEVKGSSPAQDDPGTGGGGGI
ncbi:MAG TPA: site-specific integrase [Actinomycetes bacterium]|nr:site-specific integrase [Actinomycetes bacterium]